MARLAALLQLARKSDGNRARTASTRAGHALELFLVAAFAFLCGSLLWRSVSEPGKARLVHAHQLWGVLAALLVFLPLGSRSSMDSSVLAVRPVKQSTLRLFGLLAPWTSYRSVAALLFALVTVGAALRLPRPVVSASAALLLFCMALTLTSCLSVAVARLQRSGSPELRKSRPTQVRRWPLFRRELRGLLCLLDPWVTLILSALLGASEIAGKWIDPVAVGISTVLCAMLGLAIFLLPFGQDTASDRLRQQLMPLRTADLLLRKHLAAALIFTCSCVPLGLAIAWVAGVRFALSYLAIVLVVVAGLLLAAGRLFQHAALLRVQLDPGTFAGNTLPVVPFLLALGSAALPTLLLVLVARGGNVIDASLLLAGLLFVYGFLYRIMLTRAGNRSQLKANLRPASD